MRPASAAEALSSLEDACGALQRAGDPRAAFPGVYAIITREVARHTRRGEGLFLEPAWVSRLAGRFCQRYLETLDRSLRMEPQDCGAWDIAYRCCDDRERSAFQHVALGLSAHINHDLAIGIFENIVELGRAGDLQQIARYKHDHDAVNGLLRRCLQGSLDYLAREHDCVLSAFLGRRLQRPARWVSMRVLERWRAAVWTDAVGLLRARRREDRGAIVRRMDARARRIGQLLASPGWAPGVLASLGPRRIEPGLAPAAPAAHGAPAARAPFGP
jgi:hypothetical protein